MKLYAAQNRYIVLMGGAGSGKSIFAGRKILERITAEKGHRILVLRKVARTLRESCFSQLSSQATEYYEAGLFSFNKTDMSISHKNGSKIIFAGLDDNEKLKSIYNITGIWVEEASEITEADFNQLDIRLRGETPFYKQIILSFNPISVNHWLKQRFFDRKSRAALTHKSTYRDNRFLDAEAKKVLKAYKDTDEYYYNVYCLGNWGVYGGSIFDTAALSKRLEAIKKHKPFTCIFDTAALLHGGEPEPISDPDGFVRIYCYPKENARYVIGADTAGEGSDYFVAQVVDTISLQQAAILRGHFDEDLFAGQIYAMAKFYNNALVGIETNFSSYPSKKLAEMGYTNQFLRITEDSITGRPQRAYGFKTTSVTRPVILAGLTAVVRENAGVLNDETTVNEMLSFIRNSRGRSEAAAGAHDDTVMSLAIAYYLVTDKKAARDVIPKQINYDFDFEKPNTDPLGLGEVEVF